jgi:acyl-CoA thioesterase FadM
MTRPTIQMPEIIHFETKLKVRITDINYGNHLGNDSLLSLIHEARMELFTKLGYTELSIEGTRLLISDMTVIYQSEVFYGEMLKIEISVCEFNKYGCNIYYRVENASDGRPVALARSGIIFKSLETQKVTGAPEKLKVCFEFNH